jgi:NAD(P)-dependent dehydrogenase (short-subunit alcohol dehydrogenase family)
VGADGIVVNALIPGNIRTGMNPTATQEPEAVYPYARELATLSPDGPNGKGVPL